MYRNKALLRVLWLLSIAAVIWITSTDGRTQGVDDFGATTEQVMVGDGPQQFCLNVLNSNAADSIDANVTNPGFLTIDHNALDTNNFGAFNGPTVYYTVTGDFTAETWIDDNADEDVEAATLVAFDPSSPENNRAEIKYAGFSLTDEFQRSFPDGNIETAFGPYDPWLLIERIGDTFTMSSKPTAGDTYTVYWSGDLPDMPETLGVGVSGQTGNTNDNYVVTHDFLHVQGDIQCGDPSGIPATDYFSWNSSRDIGSGFCELYHHCDGIHPDTPADHVGPGGVWSWGSYDNGNFVPFSSFENLFNTDVWTNGDPAHFMGITDAGDGVRQVYSQGPEGTANALRYTAPEAVTVDVVTTSWAGAPGSQAEVCLVVLDEFDNVVTNECNILDGGEGAGFDTRQQAERQVTLQQGWSVEVRVTSLVPGGGGPTGLNVSITPSAVDPLPGPTQNLLSNGSFEDAWSFLCDRTVGPGIAGHDGYRVVGPDQGITPLDGDQMARFETTNPCGMGNGSTSQLVQLVDVGPWQSEEGEWSFIAHASFNRIAGGSVDNSFGLSANAYPEGRPFDSGQNGSPTASAGFGRDTEANGWSPICVWLPIPPGTGQVELIASAKENVQNDPPPDELDGHYTDLWRVYMQPEEDAHVTFNANGPAPHFWDDTANWDGNAVRQTGPDCGNDWWALEGTESDVTLRQDQTARSVVVEANARARISTVNNNLAMLAAELHAGAGLHVDLGETGHFEAESFENGGGTLAIEGSGTGGFTEYSSSGDSNLFLGNWNVGMENDLTVVAGDIFSAGGDPEDPETSEVGQASLEANVNIAPGSTWVVDVGEPFEDQDFVFVNGDLNCDGGVRLGCGEGLADEPDERTVIPVGEVSGGTTIGPDCAAVDVAPECDFELDLEARLVELSGLDIAVVRRMSEEVQLSLVLELGKDTARYIDADPETLKVAQVTSDEPVVVHVKEDGVATPENSDFSTAPATFQFLYFPGCPGCEEQGLSIEFPEATEEGTLFNFNWNSNPETLEFFGDEFTIELLGVGASGPAGQVETQEADSSSLVPPPDTELVDPAIQVDLIGLTAEQLVVTITGELPATPANIARVPGAGMTRYENAGADGVPLPVQDLSSEIDGNALKVTVTAVSDENSIFAITLPELTAVPGDCNQDGELRLSDAVCLLGALFRKRAAFPCGDGSRNESANVTLLDWQPNGSIGIADAVGLIHFLVLGGAPHPLAVESAETTACVPIPGCTPGPSCP